MTKSDGMVLRSVLFAPGNRADVVRKLPRSRPDAAIIDLEDAVPAGEKEAARAVARMVAAELAQSHPRLRLFVRINAADTPWFDDDVARALVPTLAGVVLPKYERPEQLEKLAAALRAHGLGHLSVIAGIETATGVDRVGDLLHGPVIAAYFGAEDFIVDMGGERTPENLEVLYARSRVAVAARVAGVAALDQVVVDIRDEARFLADAAQARALGYCGKLCIHPAQVPLARQSFTPGPGEVERARRMLDAYDRTATAGRGVIAFEGQMIDQPMIARARAVLARAAQGATADGDAGVVQGDDTR